MDRRVHLLGSFLLTAVIALGAASCGDDSPSVTVPSVTGPAANAAPTKVTPAQGQELIQQLRAELTIIDVRTADEFAAGHIEGAVNYDIEGGQFSALIEPLDRSKPYMVYCHSGRRSALAADAMVAAGFTQVYDLGGLSDWSAAGLPVVTG
jgi:rhodanese-related sulfurtransferase